MPDPFNSPAEQTHDRYTSLDRAGLIRLCEQQAGLIAQLESFIDNELEDIHLDGEAKSAEIAQLKGALRADDLRNHQAAEKAGILYVGCDTPEDLADEVCKLQGIIARMEAQIEEAGNNER